MSDSTSVGHGATVILASGTGAKLFVNEGDGQTLNLKFKGCLEPADLDDDGPAGKTPPDQPKQELDEATFSKQLAKHLYSEVHAGRLDNIVLIADPDTLGELRALLHKEVEDAIVFTAAKTLVNADMDEIERSLSNL